jgi:hypothetical protein
MRCRRALVLAALLSGAGCAVDRGPLKLPDPIPLITPSPGLAVIYLLRVPREPFELLVHLNGSRVAALPKESFTALALKPGTYELLAVHPNTSVPSAVGQLTVSAGERRFLYSAVPTRGSVSMGVVPVAGVVVPVFASVQTPTGARRWTELSEFDAQGMFSVLTPVAAEINAP